MNLGELIKLLRASKDWNQARLAEESKIPASTISRIEKGRIESPSDEIKRKLARAFGISSNALNFGESSGRENGGKVNIGFGHCLWASPIIKLIMEEGGAKDISITSYGIADKDSVNEFEPYYYDLDDYRMTSSIKVPPKTLNVTDAELLSNHIETNPETKFKIYTADALLRLMNGNYLDCIVVPSEIYDSRFLELTRAGHITYTAKEGCKVCVVGDKKVLEGITENEFINNFSNISDSEIKVFYPRRTIADAFASYFKSEKIKSPTPFKLKTINLENLEALKNDVIVKSFEKGETFILLGWEPQISWINQMVKEISNEKWELKQFEVLDISDFRGIHTKTPFLSFDILFKKITVQKLIEDGKLEIVNSFFSTLHGAIERLSKKEDITANAEIISLYLNMKIERTEEALEKLNFRFMHYPEWVQMVEMNKNRNL